MKQKHLGGRLAAALVGVMGGGAALGDDHGNAIGPPVDCWRYPPMCQGECAELNACRANNSPVGSPNCWSEEFRLDSCSRTWGG